MTDTDTPTMPPNPKSPEARLNAAVEIFDLPHGPALGYMTGALYDLDHGPLKFGKRYRVTQSIASNRGDALVAGQNLRFLGADHRTGTELLLHFEAHEGDKTVLHFDQNAPQSPEKRRYLRDAAAHFRPILIDFSKRRKRLLAAHAVLFHLRTEHEASL